MLSRKFWLSISWLAPCLIILLLAGCAGISDRQSESKWNKLGSRATEATQKKKSSANNVVLQITKGRSLEQEGKLKKARQVYETLTQEYPNHPAPYHRLAVVSDRQRKHIEAQQLYTQALRLKPNDAEILNNLGYCFYLQGQLEKAESALLKAAGTAPANPRIHNNLGLVYGHMGRHEESLAQFRHTGHEADAQYNLAFVLASKGNVEAAKQCFHTALVVQPNHLKARKALQSFEHVDTHPELLEDIALEEDSGIRWVPYVEGHQPSSNVAVASATAPVVSANSVQKIPTHTDSIATENISHRAGSGKPQSVFQRASSAVQSRFSGRSNR